VRDDEVAELELIEILDVVTGDDVDDAALGAVSFASRAMTARPGSLTMVVPPVAAGFWPNAGKASAAAAMRVVRRSESRMGYLRDWKGEEWGSKYAPSASRSGRGPLLDLR
jgi:hypothetical protein